MIQYTNARARTKGKNYLLSYYFKYLLIKLGETPFLFFINKYKDYLNKHSLYYLYGNIYRKFYYSM